MFGRLQVLLNKLEAWGHIFSKAQINLKTLDSFLNVLEPKTTTIQEARNIKTLAWDELFLRVHEVNLQNRDHLPNKDYAALKSRETNSIREEKMCSSKANAEKVKIVEFDVLDNNFGGSTDNKMTLMSKKFKKMLKKK